LQIIGDSNYRQGYLIGVDEINLKSLFQESLIIHRLHEASMVDPQI